jgi:L-ascorbate 6-phosphate lactonase
MRNYILNTAPADGQLALFYLGQEGFLIKWRDKYIIIDAFLTGPVAANKAEAMTRWLRSYPAPVGPEQLDFVDYVLCTHDHGDHTDRGTITGIAAVNKKAYFIASRAFSSVFTECGVPADHVVDAIADKPIDAGDIKITPVPAAHEQLHINKNGDYEELGFIFDFAGLRLFHAGDCCVYEGLAERITGVDILMLPINGRDWFRNRENIIGNMDSREALLLAREARAKLIIPMHFDLYARNAVPPSHFVDFAAEFCPEMPYHIFKPGERYIWTK